jgi:hypothetical protein
MLSMVSPFALYPPHTPFHMRGISLVAVLIVLVAPAVASPYGCFAASANQGVLSYTDATGNSPSECSNACLNHGPAVIVSGASVSAPGVPARQLLTRDAPVLLRSFPPDDAAGQQRVQYALPRLAHPVLRRPERHHQRVHQRLRWQIHVCPFCTEGFCGSKHLV